MHIEEIIENLIGIGSWTYKSTVEFLPEFDQNLFHSINNQTSQGSGLTEKQSLLVEKILRRHLPQISAYFGKDMSNSVNQPTYKFAKRVISQDKSVCIFKSPEKNSIQVRFPYDEVVIDKIKKYKTENSIKSKSTFFSANGVDWNHDEKVWEFDLTEPHLIWLKNNLYQHHFKFEDELIQHVQEIEKIQADMEKYIPMLIFNNGQFEFINTHKNIPQPNSTHLLEVLQTAKQYGISTWDESIETAISDISINDLTKLYFKSGTTTTINVDNKLFGLEDFKDIIDFSKTTLFVIPGGSELDTLKLSYEFLKSIGITNDTMTVLFRLDSSAGKMCNDFVKDNALNNPLTENIKIVFISARVPKPLLASRLPLDVIINLGTNSAHYTVKNLIQNHHNVLNYTIERPKKENNFGYM